jgi:hypothetical protein
VVLFSQMPPQGEQKPGPDTTSQQSPPTPPLRPPLPDPRIKIVQPAVDKGVAYLRKKVPELASLRAGYAGLNGLALLECGVPADDPDVLRIAQIIRQQAPQLNQVYDLSASLFFLNRWHESRPLDEKDRATARTLALRLIAGQTADGIWSYGGVILTPERETKLLADLRDGTYKPSGPVVHVVSLSNTQFAMLAVWGARKYDVPVREPLLALAAYFHRTQHPDGSWNYPGYSLRATSTCAALIALAIEKALLEDREFTPSPRAPVAGEKRADVEKGFAFVARTIGRKKEDPGAGSGLGYGGGIFDADAIGDLYFLWTLERLAVVYSKEEICGKNWYDWAYPIVMAVQNPDGSWEERHRQSFGPLIDTPLALLFLKRSNIAKDLTDKLRELSRIVQTERPPASVPPRGKGG